MPKRTCTKCRIEHDISDYRKDKQKKDGIHPHCIHCRREDSKKYTTGRRGKDKNLRNIYGITLEQWEDMYKNQDSACAICKDTFSKMSGKFIHVDHCHKTNKVRGLLCVSCNHLLGKSKDDTGILANAIQYLKNHSGGVLSLRK